MEEIKTNTYISNRELHLEIVQNFFATKKPGITGFLKII